MRKLTLLAALALAPAARAQLALELAGSLNISPLTHCYAGGAAYDADIGRLWISGASTNDNEVYELDPLTGNLLFSFDASVVPGLLGGPDALALDPGTGNLVLFSSFGAGEAQAVVTPSGQLVALWSSVSDVSGATFTGAGELWTFNWLTRELQQQSPVNGSVLQSVPVLGFNGFGSSLVWDPISDELLLFTDALTLLAVDRVSGAVLASTDLSSFQQVNNPAIAGMAFNGGGQRLFLNSGETFVADSILIFDRLGPVGSSFCTPAVPNSTGLSGSILALGSDIAGGNPLVLRMQDLPPNEFGYFLCSTSQGFFPNAGGSQGALCLALPIGRFQSQLGNSGQGGVIAIDVDTLALPLTPQVAVQAGETWNFQGWYRDNNPAATSNFTDATSVFFQ